MDERQEENRGRNCRGQTRDKERKREECLMRLITNRGIEIEATFIFSEISRLSGVLRGFFCESIFDPTQVGWIKLFFYNPRYTHSPLYPWYMFKKQ